MRATPGVETETTSEGGIATDAALPSCAGTPADEVGVLDVEGEVDADAESDAEGDEAEMRDRGGTDVSRRQPAGTQADLRGAAEWSGLDEVDDERDEEGWSRCTTHQPFVLERMTNAAESGVSSVTQERGRETQRTVANCDVKLVPARAREGQ